MVNDSVSYCIGIDFLDGVQFDGFVGGKQCEVKFMLYESYNIFEGLLSPSKNAKISGKAYLSNLLVK